MSSKRKKKSSKFKTRPDYQAKRLKSGKNHWKKPQGSIFDPPKSPSKDGHYGRRKSEKIIHGNVSAHVNTRLSEMVQELDDNKVYKALFSTIPSGFNGDTVLDKRSSTAKKLIKKFSRSMANKVEGDGMCWLSRNKRDQKGNYQHI